MNTISSLTTRAEGNLYKKSFRAFFFVVELGFFCGKVLVLVLMIMLMR